MSIVPLIGACAAAGAGAAPVAPVVTADAVGFTNTRGIGGLCEVGLQWNLDGEEYRVNANGSISGTSQGTWLDAGTPAQVWVLFNRTGGTAAQWIGIANNTRIQITVNRTFRIQDTSTGPGAVSITGGFAFYDAASAGNLLDATANDTWIADYEEICPMCCFTPDTLITLAGGLQVPIGEVQVGDEIKVEDGVEAVTEIIVQLERTMYLLTFADGRILRVSDDHPLFVSGKGYAAIKPVDGYKDLGKPELLKTGDKIRDEHGGLNEIISVALIDYPGAVMTFENSKFYANGLLVY